MRGKKSWIASSIAEGADTSGPPPAIFWRAPGDSDSASYGHAADAARYDGILRVLRGLLEGKLAKENVGTEADRKALASLLAFPIGKNTNFVIASGHWSTPPAQGRAGATGRPGPDELVRSMLGWYLHRFRRGPREAEQAAEGRGRRLRAQGRSTIASARPSTATRRCSRR